MGRDTIGRVKSNTQSSAEKVAGMVECSIGDLISDEGLDENKILAWQLVFPALQKEALKLVVGAFGEWPKEGGDVAISPDDAGLWKCETCMNINPPKAAMCLGGCGYAKPEV